ncbi:hypothetical protein SDJN02_16747, partial [Cucurbita argyrosperma subsp. argyrosperma]
MFWIRRVVGRKVNMCSAIDENEVKEKLDTRFSLLRDIKDNERLRTKLEHATSSLQLYEEYKSNMTSVKTHTQEAVFGT